MRDASPASRAPTTNDRPAQHGDFARCYRGVFLLSVPVHD
ncbi:hypothetical protein OH687_29980 [Burkholderia anthina]|nr:hypothetical protein OH687_29980 [Burkholderia anthina]